MRKYLIFSVLILAISCHSNHAQKSGLRDPLPFSNTIVFTDHIIDTVKLGLNYIPKGNYESVKQHISIERNRLYERYLSAESENDKIEILDSARNCFTKAILNDIIPFWYGTVWDFNGYTNKPNQGVIACGYFVSTTLFHTGININRFKLAQQAGMNEARSLSPENKLHIFNLNFSFEIDSICNTIEKEFEEGLYFVGLSNHVGFLYIKEKTAYFIHSNYIDGYVMTEKARYSNAFTSSIYVIADITHNDFLIKQWLTNSTIPVISE